MLLQLITEEAKQYSSYSKYGEKRSYSESIGNKDLRICLDLTITDDLLEEGILNEVIRGVNNQRKQIGLTIDQRIKLYCPIEFRQSFLNKLKDDTLCDYLTWFDEGYANSFIIKIGNTDVRFAIGL